MNTKITNVSALTNAIATLSTIESFNADDLEKLKSIKSSYERKNSGKESKTKEANRELANDIMDKLLADGKGTYTATDVVNMYGTEYTNQKISRVLNEELVGTRLTKGKDKGRTIYTVVS